MNLSNFFRKKENNPTDLERAEKEGLITKEEFLRLKIKRAEEDLRDFLARQKSGKK